MTNTEIKNLLFLLIFSGNENGEKLGRFNITSDLLQQAMDDLKNGAKLTEVLSKIPIESEEDQKHMDKLMELAEELEQNEIEPLEMEVFETNSEPEE